MRYEDILSFLPRFERGEFADAFDTFLRNGIDSPVVDELSMCISKSELMLVFDWMSWRKELAGDPFDPSFVSDADLETIRKLLTYAVRENRFSDGSFARRCSDGSMERVIRRLAHFQPRARS